MPPAPARAPPFFDAPSIFTLIPIFYRRFPSNLNFFLKIGSTNRSCTKLSCHKLSFFRLCNDLIDDCSGKWMVRGEQISIPRLPYLPTSNARKSSPFNLMSWFHRAQIVCQPVLPRRIWVEAHK
ncbi:hypothetical protein Scep_012190 [Stephania cephalantha]|uniref:Uncharacterized protein n=1 Tax=Stephania cephalantha TaxID=152367 RepID=A0AAP0JGU1_9MAGN